MRRPLWLDEGIAGPSPDEGARAGCLRCGGKTLAGFDLCDSCGVDYFASTDVRCDACGDEDPFGSKREPCSKCGAPASRKRDVRVVVGKQPNQ